MVNTSKRINGWWHVAIWVTTILVTMPFWYNAAWFPIMAYIAASVGSFLIHRRNGSTAGVHTSMNRNISLLNQWNDAHLQTIDWLMDRAKISHEMALNIVSDVYSKRDRGLTAIDRFMGAAIANNLSNAIIREAKGRLIDLAKLNRKVHNTYSASTIDAFIEAKIDENRLIQEQIEAIELEQQEAEQEAINPRYISRQVMTEVWNRDGGKCVKCGSQIGLEFDHIIPVSKGGSSTVNNVQLLCQQHNRSKGNREIG